MTLVTVGAEAACVVAMAVVRLDEELADATTAMTQTTTKMITKSVITPPVTPTAIPTMLITPEMAKEDTHKVNRLSKL